MEPVYWSARHRPIILPRSAAMKQLVFVYGSLRVGEEHHPLLRRARRLGQHRTPPRYTMFDLGRFPGVVAGGRSAIVGEVFVIDRATLARLDAFEDCPRAYRRTRIRTRFGRAWIYVYRRRPRAARSVPGGDWRRR